ncbi:Arc family DNA-binding protein [Acinetobacter lactucae]|uniref:Arc family DNA-binding protein n=1 Tax=Acinetobacter lactucae TaxID=1785128 RepID=UPI0003DFB3D3|nr:Arc family DNA-binding protein [Acinetobacter lactucae]ETR94529.1 arc-like DNA binding domain protein [Acinetobacter lactucae]
MSENQRDPQYKLRWPEELRDKVAASAKAYNRSMNADIIARLERSFILEPELSPLNMPPEELEARLTKVLEDRELNKTKGEDLHLEISSESEKDKKIQSLEEQLANSMKMMEMITGMFESMLNGNQEEYMESVFKKYPNVKKLYNKNAEEAKKIIDEESKDDPVKGSW